MARVTQVANAMAITQLAVCKTLAEVKEGFGYL